MEAAQHLDIQDLKGVNLFLGIKFIRNENGAWLSQTHYTDQEQYREMICTLLFLAAPTRQDISAAVAIIRSFTSRPNQAHIVAVKRVLRYLKGSLKLGLRISGAAGVLEGHSDADWGCYQTDRQSTTGCLFMMGGTAISWRNLKQKMVTLSTTESEFVAASELCKDITLEELSQCQQGATPIWEDDHGAITWAESDVRKAKHVAIRKHVVMNQVAKGIVQLQYWATPRNMNCANLKFLVYVCRHKYDCIL